MMRYNEANCASQEYCRWRASSPAEPPWMFAHTRHSNDSGVEFHSVWPLPCATGPLCTHYLADWVNWTNHLWLSTDCGLVIQQRQRSFFIMRYDIAAWVVEAVCRRGACACTWRGVRRRAGTVIAHNSFRRIWIWFDCIMWMLTGNLAPYYECKCAVTFWGPRHNSRVLWAWMTRHPAERKQGLHLSGCNVMSEKWLQRELSKTRCDFGRFYTWSLLGPNQLVFSFWLVWFQAKFQANLNASTKVMWKLLFHLLVRNYISQIPSLSAVGLTFWALHDFYAFFSAIGLYDRLPQKSRS